MGTPHQSCERWRWGERQREARRSGTEGGERRGEKGAGKEPAARRGGVASVRSAEQVSIFVRPKFWILLIKIGFQKQEQNI